MSTGHICAANASSHRTLSNDTMRGPELPLSTGGAIAPHEAESCRAMLPAGRRDGRAPECANLGAEPGNSTTQAAGRRAPVARQNTARATGLQAEPPLWHGCMRGHFRGPVELPAALAVLAEQRLGETPAVRTAGLAELRTRLQCRALGGADIPSRLDDQFLVAFLRARKFDVGRAEQLVSRYASFVKGSKYPHLRLASTQCCTACSPLLLLRSQ